MRLFGLLCTRKTKYSVKNEVFQKSQNICLHHSIPLVPIFASYITSDNVCQRLEIAVFGTQITSAIYHEKVPNMRIFRAQFQTIFSGAYPLCSTLYPPGPRCEYINEPPSPALRPSLDPRLIIEALVYKAPRKWTKFLRSPPPTACSNRAPAYNLHPGPSFCRYN
jgi:hypothetical protein